MTWEALSIGGAFVIKPRQFSDQRGTFLEWFQESEYVDALGAKFSLAQANCSVSARGVLRGIHFADVPPGQAKYVTCVNGSILDVVVDIRIGSVTYGCWEMIRLDAVDRCAVYVSEGLGHAFMALEDNATVIYLTNQPYSPTHEHEINPLDPSLAIDWPTDIAPILSEKDSTAPTLAAMAEAGKLPYLMR